MNGKTLGLIVLVSVVAALASTAVQKWLFDDVSTAVTGGVVGAISAAVVLGRKPKRE